MGRLFPLVIAGVIVLGSVASRGQAQIQKKSAAPVAANMKDPYGDPVPTGALARIGSGRYRLERTMGFQPILSPDGKLVAIPMPGGTIELRELPGWTTKRSIAVQSIGAKGPLNIEMVAFSHDSKRLVAADPEQRQLHLLDLATGKTIKSIRLAPNKGAIESIGLTIARDQRTVVFSCTSRQGKGSSQEFAIWDLVKDKVSESFKIPLSGGVDHAVSTDGRRAAQITVNRNAGGRREAFGIEIWDLATGKSERKALYLADQTGTIVRFDPMRGERVAEYEAGARQDRPRSR